ncbi:DUF4328 domain-containing protein [Micromonospora sp. NPDC023956]|uniref:DUF4328 domain-containing protein n=1 Tax=Micromonospora sp. NPDC023956 TaxID=3155722 RepID=UPI0034083F61
MRCATCDGETSPRLSDCPTCGTPVGAPAVNPGVPTRSVHGVGLAASVAVAATTVCYLLASLTALVGRVLAERAARTEDQDTLLVAGFVELAANIPYLLAYLTAVVLVIVWTYRVRANLDAFPGSAPGLGAGWAIGGWLVPLVNLVVPYRVVADVTRASVWRPGTARLVGVWWAAWLVFLVSERWTERASEREFERLSAYPTIRREFLDYADQYSAALNRSIVPMVACVVAGATLIVVIRRVSAAQQARIGRGRPAAPMVPGTLVPYPVAPGTTPPPPMPPPGAGGTIRA